MATDRVSNISHAGRAVKSAEVSLADRAYEQIREQILQGSLAVGDILSRRKLANRLEMSFLPITEALQRLESEGLVESRPRIGTRVRIPTLQHVLDSYVIREALETQAARLCCQHVNDVDREQLLRNAKQLDDLYEASGRGEEDARFLFSVRMHHMHFHLRIAELARSPGLLKAIEREQGLVFNWLYDTTTRRRVLPVAFHYELAAALCSGDVGNADQAMRTHIRYGLNHVLESLGNMETSKGWRLKRSA